MEDLRGHHVLVTGATGGLGPAVVETLLACGATVTAAARRRTALDALRAEMRHNDRLMVAEADVSRSESVEKLFDAIERGTGPLAGVVHCVGAYASGPLAAVTDETIDTLFRTVFLSAALVTRASVRRMAPRGTGRVVLVGSMDSQRTSPGAAVYGALKAAVAHLVRSAAAEMRHDGVTVNAVLPGMMDTAENRTHSPDADATRRVAPRHVATAVTALLGESGKGVTGSLVELPDRV